MNHRQALAMLDAGIAKSSEVGIPMAIAVVDASTDLMSQVRMEGAPRFTVEISHGKAIVSATFMQPSAAVTDDGPVARKLNSLSQDKMVFAQGAVPVLAADGTLLGAVGVSGGPPEVDEQVAIAAAAALGD